MQFTCRALNGLLLLALIISVLNKALYCSRLIGVICKLSIPSLRAIPEGAAGPVDQRMFKCGWALLFRCECVSKHVKYVRRAGGWCPCRDMPCLSPQMGWRSVGLSRATPSIHMLTLNPSCYLSVCLSVCLSPLLFLTLLTWLECLMEPQWPSSFVPWLPAGKWTSVCEPHWHIRSSVCLIGLKPCALNPKQNEQAVRWLLLPQPPDRMW